MWSAVGTGCRQEIVACFRKMISRPRPRQKSLVLLEHHVITRHVRSTSKWDLLARQFNSTLQNSPTHQVIARSEWRDRLETLSPKPVFGSEAHLLRDPLNALLDDRAGFCGSASPVS